MTRIAQAAGSMRPGALAAVHVFDEDAHAAARRRAVGPRVGRICRPSARPAPGCPASSSSARAGAGARTRCHHPRTLDPHVVGAPAARHVLRRPDRRGRDVRGRARLRAARGAPDAEEQEALRLLAAQAGVAIRNARLYQGERVQAERVRAMATVNQRISSALELDDLLRTISESASPARRRPLRIVLAGRRRLPHADVHRAARARRWPATSRGDRCPTDGRRHRLGGAHPPAADRAGRLRGSADRQPRVVAALGLCGRSSPTRCWPAISCWPSSR